MYYFSDIYFLLSIRLDLVGVSDCRESISIHLYGRVNDDNERLLQFV